MIPIAVMPASTRTKLLTAALGIFLGVAVYHFGSIALASNSTEAVARKIVAECAQVPGDHGPCYETSVPELYPAMPLQQVFDVVRKIRTLDTSYQFCHVLAHKLGGRVVAEDPDKWLSAVPLNPQDGLCSNGFIHGVIVGRFNDAVLDDATIDAYTPDFAVACEPHQGWHPSALDQAMCYHGMGHLFDFITNAKVVKALALCQKIGQSPTGDFRRLCIEGVFMQLYQPLEPEDFALIKKLPIALTKDTVRPFCNSYKDSEAQGACLRESWPLYMEEIKRGVGASAFCSGQPNATEEKRCYESVSSIVGRLTLGAPHEASAACDTFAPKWQSMCYSFSAQAVLEESRHDAAGALTVCKLGEAVVGSSCIEMLVDHARFIFGTDRTAQKNFCAQVPDFLKKKCNF